MDQDFSILSMCFRYYLIIVPWQRRGPSVDQTWTPFFQGCFVLSLVEIGTVGLEKKILNFINVFSLFRYYLPLEKSVAFHLNIIEFPSPKHVSCQVWLKLIQWFWRRWKCKNLTDRWADAQTKGRRTTGDQKNSLQLSAQVS